MGSLDGERSVRESANRDMPQKNIDYPLNGKNEPPSKEKVFPKGAENWRWGQPLHWAILCSLSAAGRKAFHKLLSLKTPSLCVPKTMAGLTNVLTPAVCMLPFSRVWPFQDLMAVAARLLCPWGSPGKNTGVGFHFLLQGIFPIQGSNPCLLQCRQILYHWANRDSQCVMGTCCCCCC